MFSFIVFILSLTLFIFTFLMLYVFGLLRIITFVSGPFILHVFSFILFKSSLIYTEPNLICVQRQRIDIQFCLTLYFDTLDYVFIMHFFEIFLKFK